MCDPGIIEKKVEEYVSRDEMFTSIDIGNAIKRDGTWVKNREVAAWLRSHVDDTNVLPDYERDTIPVNGGNAQAALYYPSWKNPDDYTERDQKALKPSDLKKGHKASTTPGGAAMQHPVHQSVTVSGNSDGPPGRKSTRPSSRHTQPSRLGSQSTQTTESVFRDLVWDGATVP